MESVSELDFYLGKNLPIFFGAEHEVCEQNRHSRRCQPHNRSCQGKEAECIVGSRSKEARKDKVEFHEGSTYSSKTSAIEVDTTAKRTEGQNTTQ